MILVIYLFLFGLINLFISLGYSNPLNEEYMPYKFSQDSFFVRTPYFYGIVFLIVVVAWLVSIWGFVMMKRKEGVSGQDKFLMVAVFVYTMWLSLLSFAVLAGVREKVKQVSNSIHDFNNFVYNNIYLNSRFLANVREPVKNGLLLKTKIGEAIAAYCNDKLNVKNIETASQVLFTVNYYYNLHKLGLDNPLLGEATQMLSPTKLLVVLSQAVKDAPASFSPANYIYTNGIFMDDFSNIWWDAISRKCVDEIVAGTSKDAVLAAKLNQNVNKNTVRLYVLTKTASQMSQLNNYANTIKTGDALGAFFLLSLLFIGVYWLPVAVLVFLKPETRSRFFDFLGNLFGVEVPKTTQQAGEEVILEEIADKTRQIKQLVGQSGGRESPLEQGARLLCENYQDWIRIYNKENPNNTIVPGKCDKSILIGNFNTTGTPPPAQSAEGAPAGETTPAATETAAPAGETTPEVATPETTAPAATATVAPATPTAATETVAQATPTAATETVAPATPTAATPTAATPTATPAATPAATAAEHHSTLERLFDTVAKPLIKTFLNSEKGKELIKKLNSTAEDGKEKVKQAIHQEINDLIVSQPEIAPLAFLIAGPIKKVLDSIIESAINFAIAEANENINSLTQGGKGRRTYQRKQNRFGK
jgi:hypothetical protein